ncbi:MAG: hypothetical protein IJU18_03550 [Oscillospiraceae bacterium]|nr:hypothetical protein [Oscillospiraceae bacterium]
MVRRKTTAKRWAATALAVVMMLTTMNTVAFATPAPGGATEVTLGQLLSSDEAGVSRALTEREKALLQTGFLAADQTYVYTAPAADNSDHLVTVDDVHHEITALPYTDDVYTWLPQSAEVVVDSAGVESVALAQQDDAYVGPYTYDGLSYSVQVTYEMSIPVSLAKQDALLGADSALKALRSAALRGAEGVAVLDELLGTEIQFSMGSLYDVYANQNLHTYPIYQVLAKLNPGDGGGIPIYEGGIVIDLDIDEEERALLKTMTDDYADDNRLDCLTLLNGYVDGNALQDVAALCAELDTVKTSVQTAHDQAAVVLKMVDHMGDAFGGQLKVVVMSKLLAAAAEKMSELAEFDGSTVSGVIRSGLTAAQSAQLDGLVNDTSDGELSVPAATAAELPADTTVITATVAQATVHLTVEAQAYPSGATAYVTLLNDDAAHTLYVPAGSDVSAMLTAMDETLWENAVLLDWNTSQQGFSYSIGAANYIRSVLVYDADGHEFSGTLEDQENYTVRIEFRPREYMVASDINELSGYHDYGYTLTLPALDDGSGQVYEYTVNGALMDELSQVRVTGETSISRQVVAAWTRISLGELIANGYLGSDAQAAAILSSAALNTGIVRLRMPTAENNPVTLTSLGNSAYTVNATSFAADNSGAVWIPYTATPVTDGTDGTPVAFTAAGNGHYTASVSGEFDNVRVDYRLENLRWDSATQATAAELINLPDELADAAALQRHAMTTLAGQADTLRQVGEKINLIRSTIKGADGTTEETKARVDDIYYNGTADDGSGRYLKVYAYINQYNALSTDAEKLAYYYANYDNLYAQVDLLYQDIRVVLSDSAVEDLIRDTEEISQYYDKLDTVVTRFAEIRYEMVQPDERIDVTSTQLITLAGSVLGAIGSTQQYAASTVAAAPAPVASSTVDAPDKVSFTVRVELRDSGSNVIGSASGSKTFDLTNDAHVLSAEDVSVLESVLAQAVADAGVDTAHYVCASGVLPGEDQELTTSSEVTFVYVPATYTLQITEGGVATGETVVFPYDGRTVTLPVSAEGGIRYDYTVGSATVSGGSYTFTAAQMDQLFSPLHILQVERTRVDVARERALSLISALNDSALSNNLTDGDSGTARDVSAAFIPIEKDGALYLVLRVSPEGIDPKEEVPALLSDMIMELTNYDNVRINGEDFINDGTVYLQSLLNAVLNSGVSFQRVLDVVDENGDIVEMETLNGGVVLDCNNGIVDGKYIRVGSSGCIKVTENCAGIIGGYVAEAVLTLDGYVLPVYVTLEDFDRKADDLKDVRDMVSDVQEYVDVTLHDGTVDVDIYAPDRYYELFLTALLALNETTLDDFAGFSMESAESHLFRDLIVPILKNEDVTGAVIRDTLDKYGVSFKNTDRLVRYYDRFIGVVRNVLNNSTVTHDDTVPCENTDVNMAVQYPVSGIIDVLPESLEAATSGLLKGSAGDLNNIYGDVDVTLRSKSGTLPEGYEALVIGAGGLEYVTDLSGYTVSDDTTLVVLLKDVASGGTLRVQGDNVVIDLNGKSAALNIQCSGENDYIIDSTLGSGTAGTVSGTVSGAVLTAGTFTGSIGGSTVRGGYSTDSGTVRNQVYDIVRDGDTVRVLVKTDADTLNNMDKDGMTALAIELASDLAINYLFSGQMLAADSHTVYDAAVEDLSVLFENGELSVTDSVGNDLLDSVLGYAGGYDGINYLAQSLLDALTGLSGLAAAVGTDTPVASYGLTMRDWDVSLALDDSGTYLKVGVVGGASKSRRLEIVIDSVDDGDDASVRQAMEKLNELLTITAANVELKRVRIENKTFRITGGLTGELTLDLTENVPYVIAIALAAAGSDSIGSALRAELAEAVDTYYITNGDEADLKAAMEKITALQMGEVLRGLTEGDYTALTDLAGRTGYSWSASAQEAMTEDITDFSYLLTGLGRIVKLADLSGDATTLYGHETEEYGVYYFDVNANSSSDTLGSGEWSAKGELTDSHVELTMKLFTDDQSIVVRDADSVRKYNGDILTEALVQVNENSDGSIEFRDTIVMKEDGTISVPVTVIHGERLDQRGIALLLAAGGSITSDSALDVQPAAPNYRVVYEENEGVHIYTLEQLHVKDKDSAVWYETLEQALEAGAVNLSVDGEIVLTGDVAIGGVISVIGTEYIDFDGHTFVLTSAASVLTLDSDEEDLVSGSVNGYRLTRTANAGGATWSYSFAQIPVRDAQSGNWYDTIQEAVADGAVVIEAVGSTALDEDVSLSSSVVITGSANVTFNNHTFVLSDPAAVLRIDSNDYTLATNGVSGYEIAQTDNGDGTRTYRLIPIDSKYVVGEYIFLDVKEEGITADELQALIRIALKDQGLTVTITSSLVEYTPITPTSPGAAKAVVPNGTTVTISGGVAAGDYTVIIMGDTNCNGHTDSGDAIQMSRHYYGTELTGVSLLAADMNHTDDIDAGDARKNRAKALNTWADYTSYFKISLPEW